VAGAAATDAAAARGASPWSYSAVTTTASTTVRATARAARRPVSPVAAAATHRPTARSFGVHFV
jgi:hypothetical protein